jgi:uncharacterized protein YidB (DUF937 family)
MGLLDDLLGQLAADRSRPRTAPASGMGPGPATGQRGGVDMGKVMMALLPVVLAMMANRRRDQSTGPAGSGAGAGGLGGLAGMAGILGSLLGGAAGGSGRGGLGDMLDAFQRAGFGQQAQSWVGTGRNEPLPPDALERVFGPGGIGEIARRAGVREEDASLGLAQLMPEVVDRMTPDGSVPDDAALMANVETLARRFGIA